ncbi:MAG: hypothetical protein ACLFUX_00175 [Spirochaetaceae bacterium]
MHPIVVVLLNIGLAAVVYILIVRRVDRRMRPERIVEEVRGEIESIIVELNQTTDRNIDLIEDRVNRLNGLLQQADKRLAVLKREFETRSTGSVGYNDILRRGAQGVQNVQGVAPSRKPAPEQSTEAGGGPDNASQRQEGGAARVSTDGESAAPEGGREARRKKILDLHRKGIAANIIANRTGTTVGEVELIISLAERKK